MTASDQPSGGSGTTLVLGQARVDRLVDLPRFEMKLASLFPDATLEALEGERGWLEPRFLNGDIVHLAIQTMVLRLEGKVILVDTCVGEHKPRPRHPAWDRRKATSYLTRLAGLGLHPEDVDYVLCTHLHADHIGWNTQWSGGRWVPTFPRARYLVGRSELAHWEDRRRGQGAEQVNHGSYEDSVLPVMAAGLLDRVDADDSPLPGLKLRALPGHTPGQVGLEYRRSGTRALFIGDAMHHPVQLVRPEWSSGLCTDPDLARATRRSFLEEAAEERMWLIPAHFIEMTGVQVKRAGNGFRPASM
ncbi:MAG TPA: MBL fold metallo-hydrolase [Alphaproteobacteria bacterium]|nr:MBL fold metallo-hydrolase [Alphaproteobacteria bacterium]